MITINRLHLLEGQRRIRKASQIKVQLSSMRSMLNKIKYDLSRQYNHFSLIMLGQGLASSLGILCSLMTERHRLTFQNKIWKFMFREMFNIQASF